MFILPTFFLAVVNFRIYTRTNLEFKTPSYWSSDPTGVFWLDALASWMYVP